MDHLGHLVFLGTQEEMGLKARKEIKDYLVEMVCPDGLENLEPLDLGEYKVLMHPCI